MTLIPAYLVGKNISTFACTPQAVGNGGTLVPGTTFDMHSLGVLDDATWRGDPGLVEISPTDAVSENYVATKETWELTLGEIAKADGSSQLLVAAFNFNYIRVQWAVTAPWGAAGFNFAVIGAIGPCQMGIVQGKNGWQMTVRPAGI